MAEPDDGPLTPTQTARYRLLRWVAFGSGVAIGAVLVWQSLDHGQMRSLLAGFHDPVARASAFAISVLAGLVVLWFATGNIARILARRVEP